MVIAPRRMLALALASAVLAACTVGPDYVRPTFDAPAGFAQAAHDEPAADGVQAPDGVQAATAADAAFWESFGDPLLTQLVEDALVANHDVRIALARYDQANA